MTDMQEINLGFGKVVMKTNRASIAALRLTAPYVRDSAVDTARKVPGKRVFNNVSAHPKVHGCMVNDTCIIPDGTLILLQADWQRGASFIRQGAVILRARTGAALLNVIAKIPTGSESLLGDTHSVFRGNADILSPEEATVFRIQVPGRVIASHFIPEEINECFEIRELAPEREPRPEVKLVATASGLVVTETAPSIKRRMRISRP